MAWFKRKPKKRWSGVIELFDHVRSIKQDFSGLTLTLDNGETITIRHRSGMRGEITMDMPKHPDLFTNRVQPEPDFDFITEWTPDTESIKASLHRVAARDN